MYVASFLPSFIVSSWQSLQRMTPAELANMEHLYEFHPPVWITDTTLRKSPFVPQMGDEVRTEPFRAVHVEGRPAVS